MLRFMSQPSKRWRIFAMANMLAPLTMMVMKANDDAGHRGRPFAVPQGQVARHGVRPANVVKRHHHDGKEEDGGNRADQIGVRPNIPYW